MGGRGGGEGGGEQAAVIDVDACCIVVDVSSALPMLGLELG